jgi:hypothetical protein
MWIRWIWIRIRIRNTGNNKLQNRKEVPNLELFGEEFLLGVTAASLRSRSLLSLSSALASVLDTRFLRTVAFSFTTASSSLS